MKKVLFLGIISFLFISPSKGQDEIDYTHYFREGVRWISGEYYTWDKEIFRFEYYEIKGDSLIGENHYNKLYWNHDNLIALLRNDDGNIYLRMLRNKVYDPVTKEQLLPQEFGGIAEYGELDRDYLLYSFTNKWVAGSSLLFTSLEKEMQEPIELTIEEALLDTIQLDNGKYHKRYGRTIEGFLGVHTDDFIYGLGDYSRGPFGALIYYAPFLETRHGLLALYDHDELVFRSRELTAVGMEEVKDAPMISTYYSPGDRMLHVDTALPEGSFTIDLFCMGGIKVFSFSEKFCNLSSLPAGFYLVRMQTRTGYIRNSKIRIE